MKNSNLHIFNPSCETAIANGTVSYLPNKTLQTFENDLAFLPSIFSKNDDLILMPKYEELQHLEILHSLGFPVPGQILQTDFFDQHQKIISEIEQYKLWGWSPNWIHRLKKNTNISCPKFEKSTFYNWDTSHKKLYSRTTAKEILETILRQNPNSIYIDKKLIPSKLTTITEIEAFLVEHQQIVLKEPWSSSGRGIIMLRKNTLNQSITQRINGVLKQQNYIMAEPMLNKQLDMALHFKIKNQQVSFIGDTYFQTNSNGQYQANYLNQVPNIDKRLLDFIEKNKNQLIDNLILSLSESKININYEGFLGIDVMLIEENKNLFFQPCVEINLRNNMGTIALHIQKIIHPKAKGIFNVVFNPKARFETTYQQENHKASTLDGLFYKGTLALVSPKGKQFGAYINLI